MSRRLAIARVVLRAGLVLLGLLLAFAALVWWMNRDTRWDASAAFAAPGSVRSARVAIVITSLSQPSRFETGFWIGAIDKITETAIPWPINVIAARDRGVVLFDPGRPYAPEKFAPARLADMNGGEADSDGTPWLTRYKNGELEWVPPNKDTPHDTGYYLYTGRKGGLSTIAAKTSAKARYLYHGQLENGYLPHGDQSRALAEAAIAELRRRYPQIVDGMFIPAFDPQAEDKAVRRLLDGGAEMLVLGSGMPHYSEFEDLKGGFADIKATVDKWNAEKPGRKARIAVAPWMASTASFDKVWLDHFAATVPDAPAPGAKAMAIVALHGLPVSLNDKDSWRTRWPLTFKRLKPQLDAILRAKGYGPTVEAGAEAFADTIEDPDNRIVSVNELYRRAIKEKYALAIALPVEFLAENTDTLFAHQALFFEGIGGYKTYAPPPPGTDWSKPYVRTLREGDTTLIYAGAPGGAAIPRMAAAFADAIGQVFPK
jgi:hypothetical protein